MDGCKQLLNEALAAASNNLTKAKEAEDGPESVIKQLQVVTQALQESREEATKLRVHVQACEEDKKSSALRETAGKEAVAALRQELQDSLAAQELVEQKWEATRQELEGTKKGLEMAEGRARVDKAKASEEMAALQEALEHAVAAREAAEVAVSAGAQSASGKQGQLEELQVAVTKLSDEYDALRAQHNGLENLCDDLYCQRRQQEDEFEQARSMAAAAQEDALKQQEALREAAVKDLERKMEVVLKDRDEQLTRLLQEKAAVESALYQVCLRRVTFHTHTRLRAPDYARSSACMQDCMRAYVDVGCKHIWHDT